MDDGCGVLQKMGRTYDEWPSGWSPLGGGRGASNESRGSPRPPKQRHVLATWQIVRRFACIGTRVGEGVKA